MKNKTDSEYTPGPYIVEFLPGMSDWQYSVTAPNLGYPMRTTIALFRNEKDAILYSASPEILEILKACVYQMGRSETMGDSDFHHVVEEAKSVISKAEGMQ